MARIEPDDVRDPELIFVALKLRVAQDVEERLTRMGVDYAVEVEPAGRTFLFRSVRMGAAFYVSSSIAEYCREQLAMAGLVSGVTERDREAP